MEEIDAEKKNQEIKINRKSKILFLVLGILIIASVGATFYRYIIKRDYIIQAQIDCDPETENCLVWRCDPSSTVEGEACTGAPENDIWYYKILKRNANRIPPCDPKDENCTAYQCETNEPECEMASCSPENIKEGEECSAPDQYLLENPPEEDIPAEEECAPDDEECLSAQGTECDPSIEDCSAASSEECAPDDESCAPVQEEQPAADSSVETPTNSTDQNKDVSLPGAEPM
jgi:hypothetical protein